MANLNYSAYIRTGIRKIFDFGKVSLEEPCGIGALSCVYLF